MKSYFHLCEELKFDNHDWKSYFFADVSALAYHDGTKVKKELWIKSMRRVVHIIGNGNSSWLYNEKERKGLKLGCNQIGFEVPDKFAS